MLVESPAGKNQNIQKARRKRPVQMDVYFVLPTLRIIGSGSFVMAKAERWIAELRWHLQPKGLQLAVRSSLPERPHKQSSSVDPASPRRFRILRPCTPSRKPNK